MLRLRYATPRRWAKATASFCGSLLIRVPLRKRWFLPPVSKFAAAADERSLGWPTQIREEVRRPNPALR